MGPGSSPSSSLLLTRLLTGLLGGRLRLAGTAPGGGEANQLLST
jgi:hypothetical protein